MHFEAVHQIMHSDQEASGKFTPELLAKKHPSLQSHSRLSKFEGVRGICIFDRLSVCLCGIWVSLPDIILLQQKKISNQ